MIERFSESPHRRHLRSATTTATRPVALAKTGPASNLAAASTLQEASATLEES